MISPEQFLLTKSSNIKVMDSSTNYIGIDISKDYFDMAIKCDETNYSSYRFSNNVKGFKQMLKLMNSQSWCVMEASGPYYLRLATYLQEHSVKVSVVNPLVIRRFCQMMLMRAKTDKKDAIMIAQYGRINRPSLWSSDEDYVLELRQLQTYLNQLNKQRTSFIRQQQAFDQCTVQQPKVRTGIRRQIKRLEGEIMRIEDEMVGIIESHHGEMFEQLQSIPGLGKKTSLMLIVLTGAFTKFENHKQISSYFGLSPRIFESGKSVKGRSRICKMGMSKIRAMLYMCACNAKRCNLACKQLYDRLIAKGKAGKLALIAVANKLIKQAFAIATNKTTYDPNYLTS